MEKRSKSRNFCFTDFKMRDWNQVYSSHKDIIRYLVVGKETCPKTKRVHNQGWIQMVNSKDFVPMKHLLGKETHFEMCRGSEYANDKYCRKKADYKQYGTFQSQGQRSDLEDIRLMVQRNEPMLNIADTHFGSFLRYHRGIAAYKQLVDKDQTQDFRNVEVIVHAGTTGTDKTRLAMESAGFRIQGDQLQWWDGYDGESTICLDEYANQVNITTLLGILDGYQLRLAVKGGFTYARWTKVFITTNLSALHEQAKDEHREALERRITKWKHFDATCHEVTGRVIV